MNFGLALLFAFCSAGTDSFAQGPVLIKEIASREFTVQIGAFEVPPVREVVSREFSIHVEGGPLDDLHPEIISREFGLVVGDAAVPPIITELTIDVSATGDRATLDWSGYNQWGVGDIARFDIYFSDTGGFTDITGMIPFRSVPAETTSATLDGLTEFTDHFFAVVAVDALGNFASAVEYSAAYILSPGTVSREFSIRVGDEPDPPYREAISRQFGLVVGDADPPPPLADIAMAVSPSGETVTMDWSAYNQWVVGDIVRFDIYLSDLAPFSDVTGMTPVTSVPAETTSLTLEGLTPNTDHFLAIVPVDALGNFEANVNYSAAYVLSPEISSRELTVFIGQESSPPNREIVSREISILVPDASTPAPVTGVNSGFFVETSATEFGAVVLDWTSYDELLQSDVVAYRIYVGNSFFDDVTGLTPFATSQSGQQRVTLTGLGGGEILHFAVVAEDVLGNFDPAVRSFSAQASVSGVGEVINLAATASTAESLSFSWDAPPETAAFLTGYHLYFAGAVDPIVLQPGTTTYELTGLTPATGYSLRVATLDIFSQESAGVSIVASTLLSNPANLALTLRNGNVVAIWDASEPASLVQHYAVFLESSPISDSTGLTPVGTPTATEFDLGPLATVLDLHVAVAAVNVSDGSDPSLTSVQATKMSQTISFAAPTPALAIPLTATATSGLPVRFEVDPAHLATISGPPGSEVLTALSGGNVTITAYQDGDASFWPAPPVAHTLRLPPVITAVLAGSSHIGPATNIHLIDTLLRVEARDENGISQVEFSIRPVGGSFTSLGIDNITVDGFTAILAIDALADGDYELQVIVTAALTGETTSTILPVTIQLAAPVPPTITSPASGTVVTNDTILLEGVSSRETEVFLDRGGIQVAGPLSPDASGNFSANLSILTGPNVFTARATNRAGASGDSPAVTITLRSNLTLALNPPSFAEGQPSDLTITRSNSQGPLSVCLSQSVLGQLQRPPPVFFADAEAQKIVQVTAIDDSVPELDEGVTITAQAPNYTNGSALATVLDDDRPALTLALNRNVISESASAGELTATVTRTPVTATPFTVVLSTSDSTVVQVPASLLIAPFTPGAIGALAVVDDSEIDGDQIATLTARIFDVTSGGLLAESNPVDVTVTDDDGPSLSLRLEADSVQEGQSVTAFLGRNSGIDQPLTVALSLDLPLQASVQPTVDFAVDEAEVSFPVIGTDDGTEDGNQSVLLEATAAGFATAQAELIVTDENKPDLALTVLTAPTPVFTDEWVNYTYRVENQGPRDAVGPVGVRVLLSHDPVLGNDTVLNASSFEAGLPAGLFFERTETFRTPIEAGTYYIIVEVDGENVHDEILETNNLGASNSMEVGAAYEATVSTATTVAPSGTPIDFTGSATNIPDGSPAAFKLVNVHLMVRETERILSALTNSNGQFSLTFTPLPGEGGSYTVGATHPGVPDAEVQDSFTLLGIGSDTTGIELTVTRDEATPGQIVIRNQADVGISGIQVNGTGFPQGITLTGGLQGGATTLGPLAEATVDYQFTALAGAPNLADGFLNVFSAEGAALAVPLSATVREMASLLVSDAGRLERGMVPGEQTFVNFSIRNEGSVPTGPVRILLPAIEWLSTAQSPLPALAPGQEVEVSLLLTPAEDLPLTAYNGSIQLAGDHNTLTLPFTFRALGNATGDLVVHCEDEFTYFADTTPPLEGATVKVLDAVDGSLVATGVTDVNGEAIFPDLVEGFYKIEATAPDHTAYRETFFLESGQSNLVRAFLSRQLVQYIWNVVPTQIEDRYRIVVESVFETVVPAPVVVIEPSYIDLRELTEEVTQINLTITNHGLIAANDVALTFASTADWQVTALAENLGTLAAKSSLTVPLIIRNLSGDFARSGACAAPRGQTEWCYDCGDWQICGTAGVAFDADTRNCPGGRITPRGAAGGGGRVVVNPTPICSCGVVSCDPCILFALIDCAIGFTPLGCPKDIAEAIINCADSNTGLGDCLSGAGSAAFGCLCGLTPAGPICDAASCLEGILECLEGGAGPGGGGGPPGGGGGGGRQDYAAIFDNFQEHGRGITAVIDFQVVSLGDEAWREFLDHEHMAAFITLFREAIAEDGENSSRITSAERADVLATDLAAVTGQPLVVELLDRWERSLDYYATGIFNTDDLPAGFDPDFLAYDTYLDAASRVLAAYDAAEADGFGDPLEAFIAAKDELFRFLSSGDGVCARVRLQIEQEAVMTRDAFAASLDIINNDTAPLNSINVSLKVTDADGIDSTNLFGVVGPDITGVNGDSIAGETTGMWRWTLIPSQDAAPNQVTEYFVEGIMSYVQAGLTVNVPLTAQQISVYPNPNLFLKYFHERNVYADDPFTDPIEPSIPFSLGVMVENRGAGLAKNLRIESAQPEIIENDKGLLIDFEIIASQVAGQNLSPSLTADFGDIPPGEIKVARWLLTSTLQGLFIEYEASFEHIDSLGDERLSLIESVTIHETIHEVRALGAKDDGLPDFFVNDVLDARDIGDTIHLSDGTTAPVAFVEAATIPAPTPGNLIVSLTAPAMGAGWNYLRIPDPGIGDFHVVRVTRSDGLEIPLDLNVWSTDRTFIGLGLRPILEDILHLVDCDSTGLYTVEYAQVPPPDTTPPTSMVTMLADQSGAFIDLAWTGIDLGGIAFFDVFFSQDATPFEQWLEGTNATSALFTGDPGSTYSFYSLATDSAGNEEAPKSTGETQTTVSLVNQAPQLAFIPEQQVVEGDLFRFRASGTDPDGPDALLRFSVQSDQPGLIIDPVSGWLTWVTGEQNGGDTTQATVTVTDGDPDPKSASQVFTITVEDTNATPVLASPGRSTIDVGEFLEVQLSATDRDVPAQVLTYSATGTPPGGLNVDPSSGLLTWTPGDEHEDQSFEILLEVRDDQSPAGVGRAVLFIDVLKKPGLPPAFAPFPLLVWPTDGQFFFEVVATDPEGEPVTIAGDTSGLPGWVALRPRGVTGRALLEWNTTGVLPGVYQLPLTAATDRQETETTLAIEVVPRPPFSDYPGWAGTFPLGPFERLDSLDPNHDDILNLMAYGLGVDPANGTGSVQPNPRPLPFADAAIYGIDFTMPSAGRFDLRYIIEGSLHLQVWTEVARKEGHGAWSGSAAVTTTPLRGILERARASLPRLPGQSFGFLRLRVERLGSRLAGYRAWIDPFALPPADADPLADPNRDGLFNLAAYSLDFQSPLFTTAAESARTPIVELAGDRLALLVTLLDDGKADLRYLVEESLDGRVWSLVAIKEGTHPWESATTARLVSLDLPAIQIAFESSRTLQEAAHMLMRLRVEPVIVPPEP